MPDSILPPENHPPRPNGHDPTFDQRTLDGLIDALHDRVQPATNPITDTPRNRHERRAEKYRPQSVLSRYRRIGQFAGIVCGCFGGISMMLGYADTSAGFLGIVPALLGGLTVGAITASLWHVAMHAAERVRTDRGRLALCLGAAAGALVAMTASSWSVASLLSGRAALNEYQTHYAGLAEDAEDAAWHQAQEQQKVLSASHDAASDWLAAASAEVNKLLTGKSGRGPIYSLLKSLGDKALGIEHEENEEFERIQALHNQSKGLRLKLRAIIGQDDDAFAALANALRQNIITEADFNLASRVQYGHGDELNAMIRDRDLLERLKGIDDAITKKMSARVREVLDQRITISAPAYLPIKPKDAVLKYWNSVALQGWLVALSTDLLPLIWVILIWGFSACAPIADTSSDPPPEGFNPDRPSGSGAAAPLLRDRQTTEALAR